MLHRRDRADLIEPEEADQVTLYELGERYILIRRRIEYLHPLRDILELQRTVIVDLSVRLPTRTIVGQQRHIRDIARLQMFLQTFERRRVQGEDLLVSILADGEHLITVRLDYLEAAPPHRRLAPMFQRSLVRSFQLVRVVPENLVDHQRIGEAARERVGAGQRFEESLGVTISPVPVVCLQQLVHHRLHPFVLLRELHGHWCQLIQYSYVLVTYLLYRRAFCLCHAHTISGSSAERKQHHVCSGKNLHAREKEAELSYNYLASDLAAGQIASTLFDVRERIETL